MKPDINGGLNMRKIMAAVLCLAFVFTSGCSRMLSGDNDPDLSIAERAKTKYQYGNGETFGKRELFEEIIDASKNKDTGRIKDLFSDYALEHNEYLEDEIGEYFKSFPEIDRKKYVSCSISGGHNRGSTEYYYMYTITSHFIAKDGKQYRFIGKWIGGYTDDPSMQGMHSIQLISQEMYDKHKYRVHSWEDRPGVYLYLE